MSVILFYSPFNQRSRDAESLMIAFHKQGHDVISLTQQEGNVINEFLSDRGIQTYAYVLPGKRTGSWYFLRHLVHFIRFCWEHQIDIVYSHLEPANFVASIGQYFIKAKTYLCRHHINEGNLYQFDKDLYYRITYRLAKNILVVSNHAKLYMIEHERIRKEKITHINLAYDFNFYEKPVEQNVRMIKREYPAELLLLSACRLTMYKRPELVIQTVKELTDKGLDVKLIMLGKGEMQDQLQLLIQNLNLQDKIVMPGYVSNILEFMAAADFFLHPSVLESSCVAVKEAGLVKLPVIACQGVGDFDDYLVHKENGFLVPSENYVKAAAEIIVTSFGDKKLLQRIGENLRTSIFELFSVEKIIEQYNSLNKT